MNCLNVFDHFVGMALKGLTELGLYWRNCTVPITELERNILSEVTKAMRKVEEQKELPGSHILL